MQEHTEHRLAELFQIIGKIASVNGSCGQISRGNRRFPGESHAWSHRSKKTSNPQKVAETHTYSVALDLTIRILIFRFYAALAFEELVNEKSLNEVAHKYSMDRGLLQTLQQQASTFAATVTAFCHALNWTMLAKIISEFKERLFFGVHHDLVDLMKIPNLNGHRARSLFNGGIQNLTDLANSDVLTVEKILHNSICFDSKQRDGEQQWDAEQRNKLRILYVTGKPGTSDSASMSRHFV